MNTTVALAPKPSFLLNERVYTRITNERDQLWAVYALEAAAKRALMEMGMAWSIVAIFFTVNAKLSLKVRSAARKMLEIVLTALPSDNRRKAANIMISGIEEWLKQAGLNPSIC